MKEKIDIGNLQKNGFIQLKYPAGLRLAVLETVRAWEKFSSLPPEIKGSFPYSNASRGAGYESKRGEGKAGDFKENFDVTEGESDWLLETARSIKNPVVEEFITRGLILSETMKPFIVSFAEAVESHFELTGFAREIAEGTEMYFNRFIRYPAGQDEGKEIATAHPDQSGFTLHLYESAAGLQYLSLNDRTWNNMPVSEGETVIIPDMQLQFRSGGKLKALYHRVISTLETSKTGRFSAVCFVGFKNTPSYDKGSHGRLQEFKPGFNYDMLFDQFSNLFKKGK